MSKIRVYCPNHGLIKEIEMDCMWVGNPPIPEVEYAFCPKCGEKTAMKKSKPYNKVYEWSDQDEKKERFRRSFGIESDEDGKVIKICRDVWEGY